MMQLNPYLSFDGNTEEAFNFYKSVFGGEFAFVMRYKDVPADVPMPNKNPADDNRIMHVSLPVGQSMLMASDAPSHLKLNQGNNLQISISVDSKEDADRIFSGLSAGGSVMMPMSDAFWGDYFGMFTDKFGVHWMISYRKA
ncbi:MAG: VOC family protein [Ignavibacteria bacterium]|nr:VOC family protein [Ignavibacteria bacterium]